MSETLKAQAARGFGFTLTAQMVRFVGQLIAIGILARLLPAEDFGMIGILLSATAFLHLFRKIGLPSAIVQRPQVSADQLRALHRISIWIGFVMLTLVSVIGPILAWFVGEPRLIHVAPIYGVVFLVTSFSLVPLASLRRQLKFKEVAVAEVIAFLVGLILGLGVALLGGGYWALIVNPVAASVVGAHLIRRKADLNLEKSTSVGWTEIRPFLAFGGVFTIGEVANYLSKDLDNILIGKVWGLGPLGYYTRAYSLMVAPIEQVTNPLGAVLVPVLSQLNDDEHRYRKWSSKLTLFFAVIPAPLAAFLLIGSHEIVELVLGEGWELTGHIFFWFSLSVFCRPIAGLLYWIFLTTGKLRLMMKWSIFNAFLTIIAIVVGVFFGPVEVAIAYSVSGLLLRTPVAIWFTSRTRKIRLGQTMRHYLLGMGTFGLWAGIAWLGKLGAERYFDGSFAHLCGMAVLEGLVITFILVATPLGKLSISAMRQFWEMRKTQPDSTVIKP